MYKLIKRVKVNNVGELIAFLNTLDKNIEVSGDFFNEDMEAMLYERETTGQLYFLLEDLK